MEPKALFDIPAEGAGSVDEVLKTIDELLQELRAGRTDDWENPTLERFLGAMHSWLEDVGPRVGPKPSWKLVEIILRAAKGYE